MEVLLVLSFPYFYLAAILIDGEGGDDYISAGRFVNGTIKGGLGNDDINVSTYNYYWSWNDRLDLNDNSILDQTIIASIDGGDGDDEISEEELRNAINVLDKAKNKVNKPTKNQIQVNKMDNKVNS